MKKIAIITVLVLMSVTGFSQLGTPLTQYSGNQLVNNPAYAGIYDILAINLSVRKMWIQIPGSPSMISLNAHAPIYKDKHALGLVLNRESWGPSIGNFAYGTYAYKINLGENILSIGLQVGLLNNVIDWDKIDYVRDPDDPGLGRGRTHSTRFDANVGAYYQSNKFYLGASVKHLARPKFDIPLIDSMGKKSFSQMRAQFFVLGGYRIELNDQWELYPELMMRYIYTTPLSANVGLRASFLGDYFVGVNWQSGQKAVSLQAHAFIMENLRIGYSYDVYYGNIRSYQKGSHEISVSYYIDMFWLKYKTKRVSSNWVM